MCSSNAGTGLVVSYAGGQQFPVHQFASAKNNTVPTLIVSDEDMTAYSRWADDGGNNLDD